MTSYVFQRAADRILSFPRVSKIEFSHMCKNSGKQEKYIMLSLGFVMEFIVFFLNDSEETSWFLCVMKVVFYAVCLSLFVIMFLSFIVINSKR